MPENMQLDGMALLDAVNRERKLATVRSLDISFNELADMIEKGEIDIRPEYRRIFRWNWIKKSQFVESILLEMPIPPIYLVENGGGTYSLVDGLQRLASYLHFRGELDMPDLEDPIRIGDKLALHGCSIVPELNGHTFDSLPTALKYRIRRAVQRVEIVRHGNDPRFTYHMVSRLNMGAEPPSEQESRNYSIRLLGPPRFIDFISRLAKYEPFRTVTDSTSSDFRACQGLEELVLRFFAFKNEINQYMHDTSSFLTDYMERVTDGLSPRAISFEYGLEEAQFKKVFGVLEATLGTDACRRWAGPGPTNYAGGFSVSHYYLGK